MRNMLNGKTLEESQLELGIVVGTQQFLTRCTGVTTGRVLRDISNLMVGNVKDVIYHKRGGEFQLDSFKLLVEKLAFVGFVFTPQ